MSEETEALNDRGAELEANETMSFLDSLKKKPGDRPDVPSPQPAAGPKVTLADFTQPNAAFACKKITEVMVRAEALASEEGRYTAMGILAMLTKVKKEAEALAKDLEEEACREFEFRMAGATGKTINVGVGNFKRNGVKNTWEYSPAVQKLEEKSKAAAEELKRVQTEEQVSGKARLTVVPPAKAFAVSV